VVLWLLSGPAAGVGGVGWLAGVAMAVAVGWRDRGPGLCVRAVIEQVGGAGAWASAVLLRRGQVERHFVIMFLQNIIALVGGVILLWSWQSLYALVAFRYLRVLSGALLYLLLTRDRPGFVFDRGLAQEAAGFSGGLYGARLMNFLSRYSADLLLGLLYTTAEAGLYRFGSRVAGGAIDVIGQPMRSFAMTQFGAAGRNDKPLTPVLARFTGTVTLLAGGVGAVVVVFAEPAMRSLFDPAYLPALVVVYAMVLRSICNSILLIEPAFAAQGRTTIIMWFNTVWAVITVVAVFVAAGFGLEVLAWSQAALTVVMILSGLAVIRRLGDVPVGAALRSMAIAAALIVVYGVILNLTWPVVAGALATGEVLRLGIGLVWSLVLAAPTVALGAKLRVFTLRVFSG